MKKILCLILFACISIMAMCDEYSLYFQVGEGYRIYNDRIHLYMSPAFRDGHDLGVYLGRHYFAFQDGTRWGIWSIANGSISNDVPPKYEKIGHIFSHGYFVFYWENNSGIGHINGGEALSARYKDIFFYEDYAYVIGLLGESYKIPWAELAENAKSRAEFEDIQAKADAAERKRQLLMECLSSFTKYCEMTGPDINGSLQKWLEKGEFEKSDAYSARTCGAGLVRKYDELSQSVQSSFIANHERLLRNDSLCKLKLGQYNADDETFELFGRYLPPFKIKVGIDKAIKFKENFESLEIKDLSLVIANDKICCKSITLVDSTSGDSYSFQRANTRIRPKHYILDFSKLGLPYHNGRTGLCGKCPHIVTIQEPKEEKLCYQLQMKGYVTVKGIVKYGGRNMNQVMRYHIWIDGQQTPIDIKVDRRTYNEIFSFMISPKLGHNYIISIEDSDGNISFPIVIDLNGIQYDM